jgi:hypothetical protein
VQSPHFKCALSALGPNQYKLFQMLLPNMLSQLISPFERLFAERAPKCLPAVLGALVAAEIGCSARMHAADKTTEASWSWRLFGSARVS